MVLTSLNIEQSVAKYLADKFKDQGYNILWFDSGQVESVGGSETITLVRDFPDDITHMAPQDGQTGPSIVNVPAFSVYTTVPNTDKSRRQGIGEGVFEWQADVRIDGFTDTELQWYRFSSWFQTWFGNPDVMVDLYDYESDIDSATPTLADEKLQFAETTISRRELDARPAVRFYLNIAATLLFIE